MSIVNTLTSLGQKVDPVMIGYLKKGAKRDLIPANIYQINAGGKRVRAALTLLSCKAVGGKISDAILPAAAIELIHNYSLIMDDIIDKGEIRRGIPTVRAKYSDDMALLVGMFYREVIEDIARNCSVHKKIQDLIIYTIKETIEGERLDILFEQIGRPEDYIIKHRFKTISYDSYLQLIGKKTATLMRSACQAGTLAARASSQKEKSLVDYGWNTGLAFQITDDILDIFGEKTGKEIGKDIIEHKLGNAIIMYAFQEMDTKSKKKFLDILRLTKVDAKSVKKAIELIEKTKAKDKAYKSAKKFATNGKKALLALPDSKARGQLIELADFIVDRLY